jgi:hypothetical protein
MYFCNFVVNGFKDAFVNVRDCKKFRRILSDMNESYAKKFNSPLQKLPDCRQV